MNVWKQKTIFRWILSYLPTLLLAIILGAVLYLSAMNLVQEKAETIQDTVLQDRADAMADLIKELGKVTVQIQGDERMKPLYSKEEWSAEEKFKLMEVQKILNTHILSEDFISEICVYFPQQEYLLCSDSMISLSSEGLLKSMTGMNKEELFRLFSKDLYGTLHIVNGESLIYTSVYKKNTHFLNQSAVVMIFIAEDYLNELLHSGSVDFLLISQDGAGLSVAAHSIETKDLQEEILSTSFEEESIKWFGDTCVYEKQIEGGPLRLLSVQADVEYVSGLRDMKLLLVGYFLVCLVLGVFMIYLQTKRNYQPVGDLLKLIRRQGYSTGEELSLAKQSMEQMITDYEEDKNRISQQEQQLTAYRLYQLFWGDDGTIGNDEEVFQALQEELGGKTFRIFQFWIEEEEEVGLEKELLYFMLQNVLQELLPDRQAFLFGRLNNRFYMILADHAEDEKSIKQLIRSACLFFQEKCGIDLYVEMSNSRSGRTGICTAYDEVCALRQYRRGLSEHISVISREDCEDAKGFQEIFRILSLERKLRNVSGRREPETLDELNAMYQKKMAVQGSGGDGVNLNDETREKILQIQHYVDVNFSDKQLTVGSLAQQFQVSDSWLSRNFKKETGYGVLKYIGELRMEKAKELLLSGVSVTQTAEEVGYYDSRPLVRLFSQKENMTPMEYVKIHKKQ